MNEMSKDNKLKKANINEYIKINFEKCVRKNPNDKGTLLGIPYPYTVPSTETFDELYYWDTYFTNIGLLKIGKAKDGSLEYKVMKSGREDLRTLQKIKHNYSWVIGVSKSFNPESCLDHTGKPNSNYIADLPVFHRTPVARYENREFLGDVQFGVWYIRLRDKRITQTPFDGVVKVEKIMMDEEIENGIDSDVIDLISANIINERNPTCYGSYDEETCRLVGEIVNVCADERILDENGKIDLNKFSPITYDPVHHTYRNIGDVVGKAFSDGKSLK